MRKRSCRRYVYVRGNQRRWNCFFPAFACGKGCSVTFFISSFRPSCLPFFLLYTSLYLSLVLFALPGCSSCLLLSFFFRAPLSRFPTFDSRRTRNFLFYVSVGEMLPAQIGTLPHRHGGCLSPRIARWKECCKSVVATSVNTLSCTLQTLHSFYYLFTTYWAQGVRLFVAVAGYPVKPPFTTSSLSDPIRVERD